MATSTMLRPGMLTASRPLTSRAVAPLKTSRGAAIVASASSPEVSPIQTSQSESSSSRRQALSAALALSVVALSSASPANAFLGIGEDIQAEYNQATTDIIAKVVAILGVDKNEPTKDDQIRVLRKEINTWVAQYRREPRVSGRPSYGQTYSALNTLAGHYNNFGTQAPIPKKRLERLNKEIADATLFLSRGR